MEKEKSLLEQYFSVIAFYGMCLLNPLGALMLYGMYRFFKSIGKQLLFVIEKIFQLIFKY